MLRYILKEHLCIDTTTCNYRYNKILMFHIVIPIFECYEVFFVGMIKLLPEEKEGLFRIIVIDGLFHFAICNLHSIRIVLFKHLAVLGVYEQIDGVIVLE